MFFLLPDVIFAIARTMLPPVALPPLRLFNTVAICDGDAVPLPIAFKTSSGAASNPFVDFAICVAVNGPLIETALRLFLFLP